MKSTVELACALIGRSLPKSSLGVLSVTVEIRLKEPVSETLTVTTFDSAVCEVVLPATVYDAVALLVTLKEPEVPPVGVAALTVVIPIAVTIPTVNIEYLNKLDFIR
ncbi:hypothetical protein [Psychrobacter sp.]|uniref:hypothetical protein n=1 Tax=Psychrobacter sp. TaxID=56811 RepID=UPI0035683C2E